MNRILLRALVPVAALALPLTLTGSAHAGGIARPHAVALNNAFTIVGQSHYGSDASGYEAVFEIRNDSQEAASIGGTVDFLNAAGTAVDSGLAYLDPKENEVLPGATGFVRRFSAAHGVSDVRLTLAQTAPVSRPDYYALTTTQTGPVANGPNEQDYTITIVNTGVRPATGVSAIGVVRSAGGAILDVADATTATAALAPGASTTVTYARYTNIGLPVGTPTFTAHGSEVTTTSITGIYDPNTVGGLLATTWTVGPAGCVGVPVRVVRFTTTLPYETVVQGTVGANGTAKVSFRLTQGYLYSFLVDGSATCAAGRFNEMTLKGEVSVKAKIPSSAHKNKKFTVKGTATGAVAGDKVQVQRKSHGTWITVASGKVKSNGTYSVRVKLPTVAKQSLRVFIPNTTLHFGANSAAVKVKVKP
jgi:hypothetical protein